jgi:hypothetical protein
MLDAPSNFGITGTVPVEALNRAWQKGNMALDENHPFVKYLQNSKPDIAILGFDYDINVKAGNILSDYVNKGGVLIMFVDYLTQGYAKDNIANVVAGITGGTLSTEGGGGGGTLYRYPPKGQKSPAPVDKDRLMNGLFGKLWGKYWGEDNSTTTVVKGLPADNVVTYSGGNGNKGSSNYNNTKATAFRTKTKGLLVVGDGGFLSRGDQVQGNYLCPFYLNGTAPASNPYYNVEVFNSTFFANAMAWAIHYAEFHGINKTTEMKQYDYWDDYKTEYE